MSCVQIGHAMRRTPHQNEHYHSLQRCCMQPLHAINESKYQSTKQTLVTRSTDNSTQKHTPAQNNITQLYTQRHNIPLPNIQQKASHSTQTQQSLHGSTNNTISYSSSFQSSEFVAIISSPKSQNFCNVLRTLLLYIKYYLNDYNRFQPQQKLVMTSQTSHLLNTAEQLLCQLANPAVVLSKIDIF